MAKFCTKCGAGLHPDFGLCPRCDAEKIAEMSKYPKFCSQCGGRIDQISGSCSQCGKSYVPADLSPAAEMAAETVKEEPAEASPEQESVAHENETENMPAQPEKTVPVKAEKAVKKPKSAKKKTSGSVVITVLMSIFLFLFTLIGVALLGVRQLADEEKIEQMLENVAFSDALDLMGEDFKTHFYDTLRDFVRQETGAVITTGRMEDIVENSTVKPFVAGKLADYFSDILNDDDRFDITEKEVRKLLKTNSDVIAEELNGEEVPEDILNAIADWLVSEDSLDNIRPSALKKDEPVLYYGVHIGLSWLSLILVALVILLAVVTMLRNSPSQAAMGGGIAFIILGGLTTVAAAISMWIPAVLDWVFGNNLIVAVVSTFLNSNILIFFAILVIGVLALVARKITLSVIAKHKA